MKDDSEITILTNSVKSITGHWSDGDPFVDAVEIKDVLGWEINRRVYAKMMLASLLIMSRISNTMSATISAP